MKTSSVSYRTHLNVPTPPAPGSSPGNTLGKSTGLFGLQTHHPVCLRLLSVLLLGATLMGCQSTSSSRQTPQLKKAPDFSLLDQAGRQVTLSQLRGQWVVLYFHPVDDAPPCACKASAFTGLLRRIGELKAHAFAISTDIPEMSSGWHTKYQLTSPALSDPEHHVASQYGAWAGKMQRVVVIINPQGRMVYHQKIRRAQGTFKKLQKTLSYLYK